MNLTSLLRPRPIGMLVLIVLVATIGCAVLVYGSYEAKQSEAVVETWQSISAQIVSRDLYNTNPYGKGRVDFQAIVAYRYVVDGRNHEGQRYSPSEESATFSAKEDAVAFLAGLPASGEIEVHVDPGEPSRAVMSKKSITNHGLRVILGGIGFLIGAMICGSYLRRPEEYD